MLLELLVRTEPSMLKPTNQQQHRVKYARLVIPITSLIKLKNSFLWLSLAILVTDVRLLQFERMTKRNCKLFQVFLLGFNSGPTAEINIFQSVLLNLF